MQKKVNKRKLFSFIVTILLILSILLTGFKFYKDFIKKDNIEEKKVLDNLEAYGYTLDEEDTSLYKEYYKELKTILNKKEIDYSEYASSITKLFITDFYSLDNKFSSSDFGGLEFIHPDLIENFKLNAGDTMYNHVKTNMDGKRKQELPLVKEVTITSSEEVKYLYSDKEYDAYKVKASWVYTKDLGYETKGEFYIIKDNNKLYIVEK